MSILVKDPQDGLFKLYVKGADKIILDRLDPAQRDEEMHEGIDEFLDKASTKGFRTLLMAMKILTEVEVEAFEAATKAADISKDKDALLKDLNDQFERGLVLIGATCVEDRLQDNVP